MTTSSNDNVTICIMCQPHHSHQTKRPSSQTGKPASYLHKQEHTHTHTHAQCAFTKPRFHKRLAVKSQLKGQILKRESQRGFWNGRNNESEELLQLAPVVEEEEDRGGGKKDKGPALCCCYKAQLGLFALEVLSGCASG